MKNKRKRKGKREKDVVDEIRRKGIKKRIKICSRKGGYMKWRECPVQDTK